jgi:hypothetical protein
MVAWVGLQFKFAAHIDAIGSIFLFAFSSLFLNQLSSLLYSFCRIYLQNCSKAGFAGKNGLFQLSKSSSIKDIGFRISQQKYFN